MEFRLEQLNSGPDGAHVLVSWLGMRFSVSINVELPLASSSSTPSQRLCQLVRRLQDAGITDDEYDRISQDLFTRILAAGGVLLRGLVKDHRSRPVSPHLGDNLFLPIPLLRLVDDGNQGRLQVTARANRYFPDAVKHAHPGAHDLPFAIVPDLPAFHVDQVCVLESLVHDPLVDHVACRVLVDGEQLFCKAERGGIAFGDSVVGRDFRTMLELRAALRGKEQLQTTLRVPTLRGVLRHPDEGHVIGFLRDWVPGASLAARKMTAVPAEQRVAWDEGIVRTLAALHRLGVYWGAADSGSVIVDPHGEAWVVDFGGKVNLGLAREAGDREEGDWIDYDEVCRYLGTGNEEMEVLEAEDSGESGSDYDSGHGKGGLYAC